MCGLNIVVAQDSSIAEALESIVLFFCTNFLNSVLSVTGLDTDNTDPLNPIVKIAVDGITITGLGTPASPLVAIGGGTVFGSGTLNYLARWTPNGTTLGIGVTRDDGISVGIGTAPSANALLYVSNASNNVAVRIDQLLNATATTNGAYITNTGINTQENRGLEISVNNSSLTNTGLLTVVTANAPATGIGGTFIVAGTSLSKYALRLQDGTEAPGKVLTCITPNGEAQWQTPSGGGVAGSGTLNYLARWTPDGSTLGIGVTRDDGIAVGMGIAPASTIQLYVVTSKTNAVVGITSKTTGNNIGIYGEANGVGAGQNLGISGLASGSTVLNTGVYGEANGASTFGYGGRFLSNSATNENVGIFAVAGGGITAIGGYFDASGAGPNTYSLKLTDGTEGVGKVLTCMTATGEANWVTPSGGGSQFTYEIGEYVPSEGGIIVNRWLSSTPYGIPTSSTTQNYIVMDLVDLSAGTTWGLSGTFVSTSRSTWDGFTNTANIMAAGPAVGTAAELCSVSTNGGKTDWYLPAVEEFATMSNNKALVNINEGLTAGFIALSNSTYWCSTDYNAPNAATFYSVGYINSAPKTAVCPVRAVRRFNI
jgi:hypothetical protein